MASFMYSTLNSDQPSIRVIRLIAGNGPLRCDIFHSHLPSASSGGYSTATIPYEALSYTWGNVERTETIIANGKPLDITINLYLALSHLRREDADRILWVDAICIDQDNARERNHQVRQMASIYRNADTVIFWLGQATYATNVSLDSLRRLDNEARTSACRRWKKTDARWRTLWSKTQTKLSRQYPDLVRRQREGLRDLLERPWFERVWIIQEVANSKRAIVCCGTRSVSARVFALAPHLFAIKPSDHVQAILDIMPGRSREDSWWSQKHDLYTLLRKFRFSKAHDPRDMVYALVGIASDPELEEVLIPNYENTEQDVIQETVLFLCHIDISSLPDVADGYWNAMVDDQSMSGFLKTVDSLYTAAMDQHVRVPRGDETVYFYARRGYNIRITNEMLNLANTRTDENNSGVVSPVEFLIRNHADLAMLENAAQNWHELQWIGFLIRHLPSPTVITESVLEAATRNAHALEVLKLLLEDHAHGAFVTDRVLYAAAGSMYVKDLFEVLMKARHDQTRIPYRIIRRIEDNESVQKNAALELVKGKGQIGDTTEKEDVEEFLAELRSEWDEWIY